MLILHYTCTRPLRIRPTVRIYRQTVLQFLNSNLADCCKEGWRLNLMGGRFTSPAESRYSPIEGEALAVAEALHILKYYVLGCPTLIKATSHKPLIGVFKSQFSDIHNPQLLSVVVHIPEIYHSGPDNLCSRSSCEG